MYSMAPRGSAQKQTSVTINVSAIDGIQMPQAPMVSQQPMPQAAPQPPAAAPTAPAQPEEPPASEQAKTAFVASLEAIRQYHMATDPAEKEKWKIAAENLHKIVENDGPQMMSCKFEYTALMAIGDQGMGGKPKYRSNQTPMPGKLVAHGPAGNMKQVQPKEGILVASGPAGQMKTPKGEDYQSPRMAKPTPPGQNANPQAPVVPPPSAVATPERQPAAKIDAPSGGVTPKDPSESDNGNPPDANASTDNGPSTDSGSVSSGNLKGQAQATLTPSANLKSENVEAPSGLNLPDGSEHITKDVIGRTNQNALASLTFANTNGKITPKALAGTSAMVAESGAVDSQTIAKAGEILQTKPKNVNAVLTQAGDSAAKQLKQKPEVATPKQMPNDKANQGQVVTEKEKAQNGSPKKYGPNEESDGPAASWHLDNAKANMARVPAGLVDKVADLHEQGKTAKQIAKELGLKNEYDLPDEQLVRDIRYVHQMPENGRGAGMYGAYTPDDPEQAEVYRKWVEGRKKSKANPQTETKDEAKDGNLQTDTPQKKTYSYIDKEGQKKTIEADSYEQYHDMVQAAGGSTDSTGMSDEDLAKHSEFLGAKGKKGQSERADATDATQAGNAAPPKAGVNPPPLPSQGNKSGVTPPPLPTERPQKTANTKNVADDLEPESLQSKKAKIKKSFDQDTVNKQAQDIGTLTNAANVATAGIRAARSAVAGDTQGVVGNSKNAADIRQGQRNDQKVIAERKDEADTEKSRWSSIVDKISGVDKDEITDTEAVGAKRAFKRYDLPRKKAIADALGIENAKNLTSDELNVEVDKLFDAKRPKNVEEQEKYNTILNQHKDYVDRTAGDKEGTFTPDEARSFKNDLRQLDYPDLVKLADEYGLNPRRADGSKPNVSRNLLINQMKSLIDSKEAGRVAREKKLAGTASLLNTQIGRLRMGVDEETGEERPESTISQSQARDMASTFGKQDTEEQKSMLATLGVPEEEVANLEGIGLKDRFSKELQKHTRGPASKDAGDMDKETADIAAKIKAFRTDASAGGLDPVEIKTAIKNIAKIPATDANKDKLKKIAQAMGIDEDMKDWSGNKTKVRIEDAIKASKARDEEVEDLVAPSPLSGTAEHQKKFLDEMSERFATPDVAIDEAEAAGLLGAIPKINEKTTQEQLDGLYKMAEDLGVSTKSDNDPTATLPPLVLAAKLKSRIKKAKQAGDKLAKDEAKADKPVTESNDDEVPVITPEEDEGDVTGGSTANIKPKTPNPTMPEADIPIPAPEATKPSGGHPTTPSDFPAKEFEVQGEKEPEAIKATQKETEKPKASLRAIASELGFQGETRNKKGTLKHIGQEHMPKILKAYFDADFRDSPGDKELQDERRKAWGQVSNDKAIQDAIIAQQPEDIEAALDAIHSNMTSNDLTGEKNDILFGDKLAKVREQVEGKRKVQSETADSKKPADAFPKPIEQYSNYAKVAEQDRQWTKSPNQLRQAAAQLSTIAHQRHGTAAKGVEGDKERDEARAIMDRASALMDLHREVASSESKAVSEGIKAKAAAKPKAAPKPKLKEKPKADEPAKDLDPVKARKSIEDAAEEYFSDKANNGLYDLYFDKLYDAAKKKEPSLTKQQFKDVLEELHKEEGKWRLGGWSKTPNEIPDPELEIPINKDEPRHGSNLRYFIRRNAKGDSSV